MGRPPYEVVVRLFLIADDYWPTLDARYYQIELLKEPLHRQLNLIYAWCREVIVGDEWDKFEAQLLAPLPGSERKISDPSAEAEGQAFLTAMSMVKGGANADSR